MGVCQNCIYIGELREELKKPHGKFCYEYTRNGHRMHCVPDVFGPDYTCLNVDNAETDFVTGETKLGSCRVKNGFGECLLFDDGSVDFFAWRNGEYLIYTLTKTPSDEEEYYNVTGDKLGTITNTAVLYAFKGNTESEELLEPVFVLTEEPLENYDVFNAKGEKIGVVEGVTEEFIKIKLGEEEAKGYVRDTESDIQYAAVILDSDFYYRSEEDDSRIILIDPEVPEKPTEPIDPEPTEPTKPVAPDIPDPIEP